MGSMKDKFKSRTNNNQEDEKDVKVTNDEVTEETKSGTDEVKTEGDGSNPQEGTTETLVQTDQDNNGTTGETDDNDDNDGNDEGDGSNGEPDSKPEPKYSFEMKKKKKPEKVQLGFHFEPSLAKAIKRAAKANGVKYSDLVSEILQKELQSLGYYKED